MRTLKLIAVCLAVLSSVAAAQNSNQATPSPKNLGEAVGQYAGATQFARAVKLSPCGSAFGREAPPLSSVFVSEIAPIYPAENRNEVRTALMSLEQDMINQGKAMYSSFYAYYTNKERLDHNTACGYIAGSAISMQKLTREAMIRLAR